MSLESLRSKVVSGFFWLAVAKALGQAISWVITLIVVRLLVPQDYGLMGLAVLVNSFLLLFNELGLGAAIIQQRDLSDRQLSDLRWVILFVNLGLFGIVVVFAPAVSYYFREPALVGIVRSMGLAFVLNGVGAPSAFMLIRQMAFRKKAQAELVGSVAAGFATLALALWGFGVWSLVGGYLVLQATMNALYCLYAPFPLHWSFSVTNVSHSLQFGSQVAMAKIFWWISASADSAIVGRLLGTVQLGYYGLAVQFASLPLEKIVSLIGQVALPSFSALQHDEETLRRYYLKLVGIVAFITFPMFFGMSLVADIAIRVLLTDKWVPIVLPLQLLSLASCLRAIETLNTPLLIAKGRPAIPLFNSLLQAVVLPVAFFLGAKFGIKGVAIGWIVAWPILYTIVTGQTLRLLGVSIASYVSAMRHPLTGAVTMTLTVLLVRHLLAAHASTLAGLILMCATGAVSYLAYYSVLDRQTLRDVLGTLRIRSSRLSVPAAATLTQES